MNTIEIKETTDIWGNKKSVIEIKLDPQTTSLFNYYNQDCFYQIKAITDTGSVDYFIKVPLKIIPTLDHMTKEVE